MSNMNPKNVVKKVQIVKYHFGNNKHSNSRSIEYLLRISDRLLVYIFGL